jgi:hypothetical protein
VAKESDGLMLELRLFGVGSNLAELPVTEDQADLIAANLDVLEQQEPGMQQPLHHRHHFNQQLDQDLNPELCVRTVA